MSAPIVSRDGDLDALQAQIGIGFEVMPDVSPQDFTDGWLAPGEATRQQ